MATEEVKRLVREHADQTYPGWKLIVVTVHGGEGMMEALEVAPVTSSARREAAEVSPLSPR